MLHLTIVAALIVASAAITMPNCRPPGLCVPGIIAECPNKLPNSPTQVCPTCCCKSSENLQFYNPQMPEPICTAPPARYQMKFVSTWIRECQTDYYPINAHWSPPVGCTHDPSYRVWDACMRNVSDGVALVSQIGATGEIMREFRQQGNAIRDIWRGARVPQRGDILTGVNQTTDNFTVDSAHQYVSGVTMIAPSLDRMMGVSQLRLCDGSDWKRSLKYCAELFSTATRSPRLFPRNSVQFSNCSFGYFEFTFLEYLQPPQQPFPPPESPACQQLSRRICPASFTGPLMCASCCCRSQNVDYYRPNGQNPECTAAGVTEYRVILRSRINRLCHDSFSPDSEFSPLFATAHRPGKEIWNRCMHNPSAGVTDFIRRGDAQEGGELLLQELRNDPEIYTIGFPGPQTRRYLNGRPTKATTIQVNAENSYISILSKLVPSSDQFVGVSQLQLCDGDRWKERLDVCLELFDGSGSIQNDNCNLATLTFLRKSPPRGDTPPPGPTEMPRDCMPNQVPRRGRLNRTMCCSQQFIIEGKLMESVELPRGGYSVHLNVETVHYDDIGFIDVGEIVQIRLCGRPQGLNRFFRRRSYLAMGDRDCRTRELSVGPRGFFQRSSNLPVVQRECADMIRSGACEVPPK